MNPQHTLEDRFFIGSKENIVKLEADQLKWLPVADSKSLGSPPISTVISLRDVLTVRSGVTTEHYFLQNEHFTKKKSPSRFANSNASVFDSSSLRPCNSFEIHYASYSNEQRKIKVETTTVCHSELNVVLKWIEVIAQRIDSITNRPKNLLVFLNPFGGKRRGRHIYEKLVQPLFKLAGVNVNLVVTQRENHAYDSLVENGWKNVDGIVCVGGDGTLSEVVNGVIMHSARENGVNLNKSQVVIPFPDIRIGIIPAGSTDTVAYTLHGHLDILTCAFHIVAGDYIKADICSVHNEENYLCCFISLMSYGYLGDIIKHSRNLRWMGPARYDCAGARNFLFHRSYEGTVSFLKESNGHENLSVCSKNNCDCVIKQKKDDEDTKKWELIPGKFWMVSAANISCACHRSPNGIAPHCHFADGYLQLLLIRRISFCEKIQLLLTLSNKRRLINELNCVEIYKTKCFKFETGYGSGIIPATNVSSWNIDGEMVENLHLYVKCHQQVLNLFCRRRTV